ncbi:unnamed protein product [Cylicocyclus nassatus]|uniref:Uncharacterized protein n=1 Tax=Cylicocyclus nassatus TaxID=53992 RepID=A0AA36HCR2_CYLNA|nr:unnamed protein product [Cylicocyclus nassatus]
MMRTAVGGVIKMMRHFVAFSLLLFVLEKPVEAIKLPRNAVCLGYGDHACRARCLKQNCQNGHCKSVRLGFGKHYVPSILKCVCEDCPADQQRKEQLH